MSEKILWKEFEAGDTVVIDVERDERNEEVLAFRKAERPPDMPPVELAGVSEGDGDAVSEA
jgi:hypothetical protein